MSTDESVDLFSWPMSRETTDSVAFLAGLNDYVAYGLQPTLLPKGREHINGRCN